MLSTEFTDRWRREGLIIPLFAALAACVALRLFPMQTLYIYALYYVLLLFLLRKRLALHGEGESMHGLRRFWLPLLLTVCAMLAVFFLRTDVHLFLMRHLTHKSLLIGVWTDSTLSLLLYALTKAVLMPVAECALYGSLISFENKAETALTLLCALLLFFLLHAAVPAGALYLLFQSLPLILAFLLTKNTRLIIIAGVCYSLLVHLEYVGYDVLRELF